MSIIKQVVRKSNLLESWSEGEEVFSVTRNAAGKPGVIKSRVGRWPKQECTFHYDSLGNFTGMDSPLVSDMIPVLLAEANGTVTSSKTLTGGSVFTVSGQDVSAMIGAGSNPIVARQYTEATKTDANVVAATMFSHVFQPGAVAAGDSIVVDGLFSYPNSATLKKLRCKIGATNFLVYDASTSQSFEWRLKIRMRSLTTQVAHASGSSAGGFGIIGSAYPIEAALDFAIAQTLEVTAEWGTAGTGSNAIVLEAVDVRVERLAV